MWAEVEGNRYTGKIWCTLHDGIYYPKTGRSFMGMPRGPLKKNKLKIEEKTVLIIASIIDLAGKLGLSEDIMGIALNIYENITKKSIFKSKGIGVLSAAIV